MVSRCALAIHGGCGVMREADLTPAEWQDARDVLASVLRSGWDLLKAGGTALDVVQAAVTRLEDAPSFNAGHGAALNAAGEHELDASIMDGATLGAGAVAGVRRIRNPVGAARLLLDEGDAVLLIGAAADRFAERRGLATVEQSYFTTERSRQALQERQLHQRVGATSETGKHGTVGAVALDRAGHLVAATSTGGYPNKPEGRVGDSPIIGAGTYARDGVCAVSGTGQGEFFIRHVLGHEIASRMAYLGESLAAAADRVVLHDLRPHRIEAGAIALDAGGAVAAPFNTGGMFRGWVTPEGGLFVASHAEVFGLGTLG